MPTVTERRGRMGRKQVVAVAYGSGPIMTLYSGASFDLLDPWNSEFTVEDIAHGLAHVCRYAGQCRSFYSVAEHSLLVSDVVPELALEALMHDAAEAFLGDITRPLKQLLPEYKAIERDVGAAIFHRLGIDEARVSGVKAADLRVLAAEQQQIMPPGTNSWAAAAGVVPAPIEVKFLAPPMAKREFLDRYRALSERR